MAKLGFFIVGAIFLAGGIYFVAKAEKYEFENRTSGGVVEFRSYWQAQWHSGKRFLAALSILFGACTCLFALVF